MVSRPDWLFDPENGRLLGVQMYEGSPEEEMYGEEKEPARYELGPLAFATVVLCALIAGATCIAVAYLTH